MDSMGLRKSAITKVDEEEEEERRKTSTEAKIEEDESGLILCEEGWPVLTHTSCLSVR
jgi:hypothetical protein